MSESDFVTFGCRLNTYESEVMRGHAAKAGLKDAIVFNTCAGAAGHPQGAQGQAGREDHCHRLCCADNAGDVCRDARGFNGAWQ